jgi:hypothetical protein
MAATSDALRAPALWFAAVVATLINAGPAHAQDIQIKAALAADISRSPAERPVWLNYWRGREVTFAKTPLGSEPPVRDPRDLTGTWLAARSHMYLQPDEGARADGLAPYRPDAERIFNWRLKMNFDGMPPADSSIYCRPAGAVKGWTFPYTFQMFQSEDRIWQVLGEGGTRVIYLNQDHPKNLKPSYMGHSVGRWEGNTLVVDTIGFKKDVIWIDRAGSPAGEKLHLIERFTKSEDGSFFDVVITIDDPEYYTQPFTINVRNRWHPELKPWDFDCEESMRTIVIHGLQTQPGMHPDVHYEEKVQK